MHRPEDMRRMPMDSEHVRKPLKSTEAFFVAFWKDLWKDTVDVEHCAVDPRDWISTSRLFPSPGSP